MSLLLSSGQRQAKAYLQYLKTNSRKDRVSAPQCDGCNRVVTDYTDVYEISESGRCGFCHGWGRLPESCREMLGRMIGGEASDKFLHHLSRVLVYYPSYTNRDLEE